MHLLTAPTVEPVTLDEAKLSARVDGSEWDGIISGAIAAARQVAEQETGRRFLAQTWRIELDDWPVADDVFALYRPTAVAVSYWTGSAYTTLATPAGFAWAPVGNGFAVVPALSASFPDLGDIAIGARVRIDVTVGAQTPAEVDECVKTFIKALVTVMVHNPTLEQNDVINKNLMLLGLLQPVRIYA